MQPGETTGHILTTSDLDGNKIINYVNQDATNLGFTFEPINETDVCPVGTYKVALVIAPSVDFHWYRQNSDGTWSHKLASSPVTNLDASGDLIINPRLANRNHSSANYTIFVGYFKVTPLSNYYSK